MRSAVSQRLPAYESRRNARWHYYIAATPHQREGVDDAGAVPRTPKRFNRD